MVVCVKRKDFGALGTCGGKAVPDYFKDDVPVHHI
jgi:hypothetical protein